MKFSLLDEINQNEEYINKSFTLNDDKKISHSKGKYRANSGPNSSCSDILLSNNSSGKNNKNSFHLIPNNLNPINSIQNEFNCMKSDEEDEMSTSLMNSSFYGFKGRSPYVTQNYNINNKSGKEGKDKNSKFTSANNKQKIINGFIIGELKDKIIEYQCSVCNFVAFEKEELRKHLIIRKHFTFPKKIKKTKKNLNKTFFRFENKLNQTFMYSFSKINKKNFENKKVICRHCTKKFDSKYALNAHLNAHKYKCESCFKLFNNIEDLKKHEHLERKVDFESMYDYKRKSLTKKNIYKSPLKSKKEIDDWEEISSSKKEKEKEKTESEDELKKNDFEQSYAFIEDSDENFDFNKMVKINENI
jgi:hypothetical protein